MATRTSEAEPSTSGRTLLGTMLRDARVAAKLTQSQVGETVGMPQSSVSNWEKGAVVPGIAHLLTLADVLELKYDDVLSAAVHDYSAAK